MSFESDVGMLDSPMHYKTRWTGEASQFSVTDVVIKTDTDVLW